MKSATYIASRPFLPVNGGREKMIYQSIEFLRQEFSLSVVVFSARGEAVDAGRYAEEFPGVSFKFVKMPSVGQVLRSLFDLPLSTPMQARMLYSQLNRIAIQMASAGSSLTVFDMARTAVFIEDAKGKTVVDFDDLLSLRYQRQIASGNVKNVLGTYAARLPAVFSTVARRLGKMLLRVESELMRRFEGRLARAADHCIFTSQKEASLFSRIYGVSATGVPQALRDATLSHARRLQLECGTTGFKLAFLGNMHTPQNAESVSYISREVLPLLRRDGVRFQMHFIGAVPEAMIGAFGGWDDCVFHGFVENLAGFMGDVDVHVAPVLSGTGVKTKILDSFQYCVPTVTTELGVEGLDVEHGVHLCVARDAQEIVKSICLMSRDKELAANMSVAAMEYLRSFHGWKHVESQYLGVMKGLVLEAA